MKKICEILKVYLLNQLLNHQFQFQMFQLYLLYFYFFCFFQAFYNQRAPSNEATSTVSSGPKGGQQPPLRGYNFGIQLQSQSDKGRDNHLKMWRKKPTRALGDNQRYIDIERPRDHYFHIYAL